MHNLIRVAWNLPASVYSKNSLNEQMNLYLERIKHPGEKNNTRKWIGPNVVSFTQKTWDKLQDYKITPKLMVFAPCCL